MTTIRARRLTLHRTLAIVLACTLAPLGAASPVAAAPGPDMTVTDTASATTVGIDEFILYTITARNEGTATATGVRVLENALDTNDVTVQNVTTSQGSCPVQNSATNEVLCNVGPVAPGDSVTVSVQVSVDDQTCDGKVRTHANVQAENEPVANAGNNASAAVRVNIQGCGGTADVDLTIDKGVSDSDITAGEDVTYTITVNNVGTETANNVVVYDYTIDLNDLKLINVSPAVPCDESSTVTNDVLCRYPSIEAGGQRVITILASSQPSTCDGFARNHAVVKATNEPFANQGDDDSAPVVVNIAGCGSIPDDTTPPTGSLKINNGGGIAYGRWVRLNFQATDSQSSIANVLVSNTSSSTGGLLDEAQVFTYSDPAPVWSLAAAAFGGTSAFGTKTVFVQYQDAAGNWSSIKNDQIRMVRDAPGSCAGARAAATRATGVWHREQVFANGDVDWFKFHKGPAGRALITLGGMPADFTLSLYNASCTKIADATDAPGFEQILRRLAAGNYFVRIAGASGSVSSVIPYSLQFRNLQSGVFVLSSTRWTASGKLHIAGVVLNNTSDRRRNVQITARLHNASNGIIGTDSAMTMVPIVGIGRQAPFHIIGPARAGLHHVTFLVTSNATSAQGVGNLDITLQAPNVVGGVRHQAGSLENDNGFTVHNAKTAIAIFDKLGGVLNTRLVSVHPATLAAGASGNFDLALTRFAGVVRQSVWAMASR
jgi:uncharacterized repeat protein (TIGR01451 family)